MQKKVLNGVKGKKRKKRKERENVGITMVKLETCHHNKGLALQKKSTFVKEICIVAIMKATPRGSWNLLIIQLVIHQYSRVPCKFTHESCGCFCHFV